MAVPSMVCETCHSELPAAEQPCPNCGAPGVAYEARLATILEKLGDLVLGVPALRDLLDFAIGAAASFMRADQLGYKDRSFALPGDYYEHLAARAKWMAKGSLPPYGLWISGYYFNSGLLRLWSVRDQLGRLEEDIAGRPAGAAPIPVKLRDEANRLKHQLSGLGEKRELTFAEAVALLDELVSIVDQRKGLFNDPSVKIPKMKSHPRKKREQ
ncbi:MAG TPA: hypothetical protein VHK65_06300 [Candidatus Dormibacteraeota bacterium]|nr:hypothetical protein [Candidatus Dormibacteraeota bacterium]